MKKILAVSALVASAGLAGPVQVNSLASLGANDFVHWGQSSLASVNNTQQFLVNSTNGIGVTTSEPTADFMVLQQAPAGSWVGDFPASVYIVDNQWGGPVTFSFSAPVRGFGISVDNAWDTLPSQASIQAFNGSTSLGTWNVNDPGSMLTFLGVVDTTAEITKIVVTSNSQNGNGYFAFGDLNIVDAIPSQASSTPEPGGVGLALTGVAALVVLHRLRQV